VSLQVVYEEKIDQAAGLLDDPEGLAEVLDAADGQPFEG
jgi:hypothetical protein